MQKWRNVMCPEAQPDDEIKAIDAFEQRLGQLPPKVERIRALVSRIDPLDHYRAFENVEFVVSAIGKLDYPRYPAIDVLSRRGQIDEERRDQARRYIHCLASWLEGKDMDSAKADRPDCSELLGRTYAALGQADDYKRWLVMSLAKTLKEHTYLPWDFIAEHSDEEFVRAVYTTLLSREPSPDDLKFRLEELKAGKSRDTLFRQVLGSAECQAEQLQKVRAALGK